MTTIYHLWSRSRSPAHEAEHWLREVAPSLGLCRGCSAFRTDRAIDVPLHAPLDGSALNFFWTTRVGIASVQLLDAIGREIVFKNLRLGRVLDKSGKALSEFRTFRAVNNVRIRGGPHSIIRRCEVCNCILYAPVKSHHLVGDANDFIGLFGTDRGGEFVADDSIVEHIERPRFKNLGISKIRVFRQPLDGYPIDLAQTPGLSKRSA